MVPVDVLDAGREQLQRQCAQWGTDVTNPSGNRLLAYGFKRHRPDGGRALGTCYALQLAGGSAVVLRGSGLAYQWDAFAVQLPRFQFLPLLAPAAPANTMATPEHWERFAQPRPEEYSLAIRLTAEALRWVAAYEGWAATTYHEPDRDRASARWLQLAMAIARSSQQPLRP